MGTEPTEAENEMVVEFMAKVLIDLRPLIEGKFVDRFNILFEIEGQEYELILNKKGREPI